MSETVERGACRLTPFAELNSAKLFDSAAVLFDEIVQVLARSHSYSTRKFPVSFISRTGRRIGQ
jgi:hypothetical protein